DLSIPVSVDREIPMPEMKGSLDESIQTALSERQEIRITQIQLDSADKGIKISRAGYMPSVAASYTYTRVGEHMDVDYNKSWAAGLGLTWNIFQGGSTYYSVSRATADRNRLNYMHQAQKNLVGLEVKNAYLSAEEAKARISVAAKTIDQAQENLRIQKDRYNLQVATTTNVLDAESLLDQAQMNFITARADYARALAALNAAKGSL
ncbi:TolC family protein, partial [archaeon]|nr:TolC family protein [archaeon]